jgi:hypothetical protein
MSAPRMRRTGSSCRARCADQADQIDGLIFDALAEHLQVVAEIESVGHRAFPGLMIGAPPMMRAAAWLRAAELAAVHSFLPRARQATCSTP